jgi:hypothetical protein
LHRQPCQPRKYAASLRASDGQTVCKRLADPKMKMSAAKIAAPLWLFGRLLLTRHIVYWNWIEHCITEILITRVIKVITDDGISPSSVITFITPS